MIPIGKCSRCGLWTYLRYKRSWSGGNFYLSWPDGKCPHCKFMPKFGEYDKADGLVNDDALGLDDSVWDGANPMDFYGIGGV